MYVYVYMGLSVSMTYAYPYVNSYLLFMRSHIQEKHEVSPAVLYTRIKSRTLIVSFDRMYVVISDVFFRKLQITGMLLRKKEMRHAVVI